MQEVDINDQIYQQLAQQITELNDPEKIRKAFLQAQEITGYKKPEMPNEAKHGIAKGLVSGLIGAGLGAAFGGGRNPGMDVAGGAMAGFGYSLNASQKAREEWKKQADEVNLKLYTATADAILKQAAQNAIILKNLTDVSKGLGTDEVGRNIATQSGFGSLNPTRGLYDKDSIGTMIEIGGNTQYANNSEVFANNQTNAINAGLTGKQPTYKAPNLGKLSLISQDTMRNTIGDYGDKYEKGLDFKETNRANVAKEKETKRRNDVLNSATTRNSLAYVNRLGVQNQKTSVEIDKIKNPDKYVGEKPKPGANPKPESIPYYKEALSEFSSIVQSKNQANIQKARNAFIKRYGVDPFKRLNTGKSTLPSSGVFDGILNGNEFSGVDG